jgi:deoxyribodipyrimidine photolyase-related protein
MRAPVCLAAQMGSKLGASQILLSQMPKYWHPLPKSTMKQAAGPCLRLVLGDQLNPLHSWFQTVHPEVIHVLMEVRSETDYVLHHAQKVLGIFAAMRAMAKQLKADGHRVRYLTIDDISNRQDIISNMDALITHYGASSVEYQMPDEWRLDKALREWALNSPIQVTAVDSEHFFTPRDEARHFFRGKKQWLMESFYRHQRRQHRILLTSDGQPQGGQWNFDADNRKPWPGNPCEPPDTRPCHDHSELWQAIVFSGIKTMGKSQADAFRWPLNRSEALAQLDRFIELGLPHFGDYQDAMSQSSWRLFHSLLSFALNTKMLNPREVVLRAQTAWQEGHAPLHATEGFIRQILGWREYVRGIYWARMPGYTDFNQLSHTRPLPEWFWNGRTHMACMASALGQSLEHAYAHHIQRLMVIGNFALLAGLDPTELHRWYLGIYIDAFEWVEAPNTLGMSQWSDGGLLATKPYVSSAAYLQRMGDHCKGCRYDPKARTSDNACPFNALYWNFFDHHRLHFQTNPRLGVVYHQLKRMPEKTLEELKARSAQVLTSLENL